MTEAVIVATTRTPIGRAFKGSLKDVRPDDLSVQVVQGLLAQLPGLDPTTLDDLYWGCADPSGKHGSNLARVDRRARRHGPPARGDGEPLLRELDPDDADGLPRDQGGRGRRLRRRRGRVRLAVHELRRCRRQRGRQPEPPVRGCRRAQRRDRPHQRDVDRPARGRPAPRRLPRDGPDRGERRHVPRRLAPAPGRVGRHEPEPRREGHRRRVLRTRDPARHDAGRHGGLDATTARAPGSPSRPCRRSTRSSARTARSPRATAARSTTAPRGSSS